MKAAEMRDQTVEELVDKERELAEQLFALRLQKVTGQLEKPSRVRQVRKDLAKKALALASAKLPVKTRFIRREEV